MKLCLFEQKMKFSSQILALGRSFSGITDCLARICDLKNKPNKEVVKPRCVTCKSVI